MQTKTCSKCKQDDSRPLFRWFAAKPDARRLVREACAAIRSAALPTTKGDTNGVHQQENTKC